MACLPRHSPVAEFTMLLYPNGHGVVEGENAGLLSSRLAAWPRIMAHTLGSSPCHVSCLTLLAGRSPTPPTATRLGHRGGWCRLFEMFRGTKYFAFGDGDVLVTSSDDKHRKFHAFIKIQEIFSKTYGNWPTTEILKRSNCNTIPNTNVCFYMIAILHVNLD